MSIKKKEQCHLVMTKHSRVAQSKWLLKQLAEKDEVIDVLKNSVGIFSKL